MLNILISKLGGESIMLYKLYLKNKATKLLRINQNRSEENIDRKKIIVCQKNKKNKKKTTTTTTRNN